MKSRDAAAWAAFVLASWCWGSVYEFPGPVTAFAAGSGIAVTGRGKLAEIYQLSDGRLLGAYPASGAVTAAAVSAEGAAWTVDSPSGRQLFVKVGTGSAASYAVPAGAPTRLAWIGGCAALLGSQGGVLWDPWLKGWAQAEDVFPPEVARQFRASYVQPSGSGMAAFIHPFRLAVSGPAKKTLSAVSAWHVMSRAWRPLGTIVTSAPRYARLSSAKYDSEGRFIESQFDISASRVTLDRYGIVAVEDEGLLRAPFLEGAWALERSPLAGPEPAWSEQVAAAGTALYRLSSGRLIVQEKGSNDAYALFPWGIGAGVAGLQSDGESLWAMTAKGPRLVAQDPAGAWGFLVAPLGAAKTTDQQQKLIESLNTWIGVPYALGGSSRQGVDCSGLVNEVYSGLGFSLPRTSAQLKESPKGKLVKDALQPGDLICTPGHVAVYVGNGETIEAVNGGVKRLTIWRFKDAVVKRYLP